MKIAPAHALAVALLASPLACKDAAPPEAAVARPVAAAPGATPIAEISVTEKGFEPARIEVAPGKPVVLRFTRKVEATCADAVDVQGDPVRHMLPLGRSVDVKVTPPPSGQLAFACPMKMLHGAVVVAN